VAAYQQGVAVSRLGVAWTFNNRAWALATDPDPQRRNPARAVQLVEEAIQLAPNITAL
jgi:hypothetical protein